VRVNIRIKEIIERKKNYSDESDESDSDRVKSKPKKPSPIKPGISAFELSKYTITQLIQWCKDHRVSHSGKKEALINRILLFFSEESYDSSSSSSHSDYSLKKGKGVTKKR